MPIIDDIRINQNWNVKKSSFVVEEEFWKGLSEEKIIGPDGYEHLPGNLVYITFHWLKLAAENDWAYYDCNGNPQDLKKIGEDFIEHIKRYCRIE